MQHDAQRCHVLSRRRRTACWLGTQLVAVTMDMPRVCHKRAFLGLDDALHVGPRPNKPVDAVCDGSALHGAVLGQPFRAPWRQALWQDVQHCSAVSASSGVTRALVANRHAWLVGFGCTRRLIRSPPAAAVEKSSMAGSSDPAQPKARCRERVHVHVAAFNDRMHACMHACAAATSLTLRVRYTMLPGARACSRCGDGPKEQPCPQLTLFDPAHASWGFYRVCHELAAALVGTGSLSALLASRSPHFKHGYTAAGALASTRSPYASHLPSASRSQR